MMFIYETLRNDGKITMSYTAFVFPVNKLGLRPVRGSRPQNNPGTGVPARKAPALPARNTAAAVASAPAKPAVATGKCVISRGDTEIPFGKHPSPDWLDKLKG